MSSASEDQTTLDDLMLIDEKINGLLTALGIDSAHSPKFLEALTHKSFLHENPQALGRTYQRLEFLGDSVLGLLVARDLFERHEDVNEGELSKLKSFIVRQESLARLAQVLKLDQFLRVGKGEEHNLADNDALMADGLEALLGAIYLSVGLEKTHSIWRSWLILLDEDIYSLHHLAEFDAKSRLQEFCMKEFKQLPVYEAIEHKNKFRVTLIIQDKPLLSVEDISKKKAALLLAQQCLKNELHLTV